MRCATCSRREPKPICSIAAAASRSIWQTPALRDPQRLRQPRAAMSHRVQLPLLEAAALQAQPRFALFCRTRPLKGNWNSHAGSAISPRSAWATTRMYDGSFSCGSRRKMLKFRSPALLFADRDHHVCVRSTRKHQPRQTSTLQCGVALAGGGYADRFRRRVGHGHHP